LQRTRMLPLLTLPPLLLLLMLVLLLALPH
jgi:hypothetical protein